MRIFKYQLHAECKIPVRVEKILRVEFQHGYLTAWCVVDEDCCEGETNIVAVPTGEKVPVKAEYINTVFDGPYVWHMYRR